MVDGIAPSTIVRALRAWGWVQSAADPRYWCKPGIWDDPTPWDEAVELESRPFQVPPVVIGSGWGARLALVTIVVFVLVLTLAKR